MAEHYTVYGMADPSKPDMVRYVGVTKKPLTERLHWHKVEAKHPRKNRLGRIRPVLSWLNDLKTAGREPLIFPLAQCTQKDFKATERRWIRKLMRQAGLLNLTHQEDGYKFEAALFKEPFKCLLLSWQKDEIDKSAAHALGVPLSTYRKWRNGSRVPPLWARHQLERRMKEIKPNGQSAILDFLESEERKL